MHQTTRKQKLLSNEKIMTIGYEVCSCSFLTHREYFRQL